jgi:hypothetical protein
MSRRKPQPGPWRVQYLQVSSKGVPSRPRLLDATSKPVKLSAAANAELAALAPALLALLELALNDADLWHRMLASEHPGLRRPDWLAQAERLVFCGRAGLSSR